MLDQHNECLERDMATPSGHRRSGPLLGYIEAALADPTPGFSPVREAAGGALVDLSFGCAGRLADRGASAILFGAGARRCWAVSRRLLVGRAYGGAARAVGAELDDDASCGD
eukprot:gene16088-3260_t